MALASEVHQREIEKVLAGRPRVSKTFQLMLLLGGGGGGGEGVGGHTIDELIEQMKNNLK